MTSLPLVILLLPGHPAPAPTFERDVRPILKAHCLECHGEAGRPKGGLDLRLRRLIIQGGDVGPAVVPGRPDESPLFTRARDHEMPPGKVKLSRQELDRLKAWIAAGAPVAKPEPETLSPGLHISDDDRAWWSFQPVRRPAVPPVRQRHLVRNPIDAFLLAKLEERGLSFSPMADRETLLRRLSFGLVGLPPGEDGGGDYERVVDRLLASPRYGERWGRHWLDVAGYADSHGYTGADPVRPYAWKYRDWVLRALNADKPFSDFVIEQLAGDELVTPPYANLSPEDQDRLAATGFLRTAPDGTASPGTNRKEATNQLVADTVQIVATSLLGVTMHCAQCHNHRYDPIAQADYYRLRAVFEPAYDVTHWREPRGRLVSLLSTADRAKSAEVERKAANIDRERLKKQEGYIERTFQKQLAKVPEAERGEVEKAYRAAVNKRSDRQAELLRRYPSVNVSSGSLYLYDKKAADDLQAYFDRAKALRATKPVEDFLDALTEVPGRVPVTHLFHRGDPDQPREPVAPGGLTILGGVSFTAKAPSKPTTGRRLALARHLVSGQHPLVARVLVNRVWMHHFGRGLVSTPGDFGRLGEPPTHPELLDWLAVEFTRDWSLKRLHRLIVTSAAYRQSSRANAEAARADPDNKLLGRMPLRRLEAEALRDAVLAVAGRLNGRLYGPPVPVMPDETGQVVLGVDRRDSAGYLRGDPVSLGEERFRRGVYVQVRRSLPLGVLEAFDNPPASPNCEKRSSSTVAPQALLLMNSRFVVDSARAFAERVAREAGDDLARARLAWRSAYGRPPSEAELGDAVAYLTEQTAFYGKQKRGKGDPEPRQQALATFCHALLSSNQFLYVD